ncbi:hypothetical protein [Actinokineospora sp. UTMC 2448]|uniref:hypothetical protein n=1 Tax=Actinokineospora sp. UTMC 2448 TaxID=2268449 RepID=UPI0021649C94|nr:hypothetical protein [Actinokineospora sp. UTMC 2448]
MIDGGQQDRLPGAARLQLTDGVALLRPREQVFEAMLDGWRNQQLARNLAFSNNAKRQGSLGAFVAHAHGVAVALDTAAGARVVRDLRAVRGCAQSMLRDDGRGRSFA